MWSAVFYLDFSRNGRRLRNHVARWGFAAWLLVTLFLGSAGAGRFLPSWIPVKLLPTMSFTTAPEMLILQQLLLIVLVVPPLCAGAIIEEKTLGTLDQLLMSGLTPWRIVVGKFVARLMQVALVSLAGLPLLCWFGGLDFIALLAVVVAEAGVLGCLAGFSILASVLARTTSSAVLVSYATGFLLLVVLPWLGGPSRYLSPLFLIEPALASRSPEELRTRVFLSGMASSCVTVSCLAIAAWQLRPAHMRQYRDSRDARKVERRASRGAQLGDDPLRWKESYVSVFSPLPLLRLLPRWTGIALTTVASAMASIYVLERNLPRDVSASSISRAALEVNIRGVSGAMGRLHSPDLDFLVQGLLCLVILAVIVNLRAASGISGEREKGTWDALLLAGMTSQDMIRGKLVGILDALRPYLLAYGVVALVFAALGGIISLLVTLGTLALAWPLMYLSGAVALERSTRYANPWKSMIDALISTTLLLVGMMAYSILGLLLLASNAGLVAGPGVLRVVALGLFFVYACFLLWLFPRVARDFIKGAALTVERRKGELPEMYYTLQLTYPDTQVRPECEAQRAGSKR